MHFRHKAYEVKVQQFFLAGAHDDGARNLARNGDGMFSRQPIERTLRPPFSAHYPDRQQWVR